jgi:hypothetical protein
MEKSRPKLRATAVLKKNCPKENNRPHRRKFTQSGHPAPIPNFYLFSVSGERRRVARFFLVQHTKTEKITKLPQNTNTKWL